MSATTLALTTSQTFTTLSRSGPWCSWSSRLARADVDSVMRGSSRGDGPVPVEPRPLREHSRSGQHVRQVEEVLRPFQVGQGDEHRADTSLGEPLVAFTLVRRGPRVMAQCVRRGGGPATKPLDLGPDVVPGAADDRKVQHGHGDLCGVPPDLFAVLSEHGDLAVQQLDIRWHVAP